MYKKKCVEENVREGSELTADKQKAKIIIKKQTQLRRECNEIRNEKIYREWKAKGITDRVWAKYKTIYFDADNKVQVAKNEQYRIMK